MTKDRQIKFGCTTPKALPSNGTSRSKAKPTRTIQPMKPTSKNGKGLTCWQRFGVPLSGMNNVDSACRAITRITRITGWRLHYCVSHVMGGSAGATNRVLLHPECHDRVHRQRLPVSKPRLL